MSCLPDISEWSWAAKYSLLEAHFEALQEHLTELAQAFVQGPIQVLGQDEHYRELQQRAGESLDLLHELRKHPPTDWLLP